MRPFIIECSGMVDHNMNGILSAKIEDIRNNIREKLNNPGAKYANPTRFLIDHYEYISEKPLTEIISPPNNVDIPIQDWLYNKLVELEVEYICQRLHGTSYKITDSTNSWSFVKHINKIGTNKQSYIVKPALVDQYTDEVYLIVTDRKATAISSPSDYIDFLYLIYSYGMYILNIANVNGTTPLPKQYMDILKQCYEYIEHITKNI